MRNHHANSSSDQGPSYRQLFATRRLRVRAFASLAFAALSMALAPAPGTAKLHTGTFELFPGEGWDFSDSLITGAFGGADIQYDVTTLAGEPARAMIDLVRAISPGAILYIGNADSTYENLETAPTDPDLYNTSEVAFIEDVFVVRTREGHYAKMRVLPSGSLLNLEYTYQDDGSPSFVPNVAVQATTWGAIKALYRR
jgi:hypothetical protein